MRVLRADARSPRPELSLDASTPSLEDIDGDGLRDLLVPVHWSDASGAIVGGAVHLFARERSGSFAPPKPLVTVAAVALESGRFVSESPIDLALVHAGNRLTREPDKLIVLRGGPAPLRVLQANAAVSTRAVARADLDRDGPDDRAIVGQDGAELVRFDADGPASERRPLEIPSVRDVFAADYDGDGFADLILEADAAYALRSAAGALVAPEKLTDLDDVHELAALDVNADGKLDLVGRTSSSIDAFTQAGNATLARRTLARSQGALSWLALLPKLTTDDVGFVILTSSASPDGRTAVDLSLLPSGKEVLFELDDQPPRALQSAPLSLHFTLR